VTRHCTCGFACDCKRGAAEQTAEADRGRLPNYPSFNVSPAGPATDRGVTTSPWYWQGREIPAGAIPRCSAVPDCPGSARFRRPSGRVGTVALISLLLSKYLPYNDLRMKSSVPRMAPNPDGVSRGCLGCQGQGSLLTSNRIAESEKRGATNRSGQRRSGLS
jgi:hypothetical protein